jgi:hypothetical protein
MLKLPPPIRRNVSLKRDARSYRHASPTPNIYKKRAFLVSPKNTSGLNASGISFIDRLKLKG